MPRGSSRTKASWWSRSGRRPCRKAPRGCGWRSARCIPTPRSRGSPTSCATRILANAMTAIFVTATGTDIGKTFVTAGLIRHWRAAGRSGRRAQAGDRPASIPPRPKAATPACCSRRWAGRSRRTEIERISPWRYAAPLSPDLAARREGRALPFDELVEFCRAPSRRTPARC